MHPIHQPAVSLLGPVRVDAPAPAARERSLLNVIAWLSLHPNSTGPEVDRALGVTPESRMASFSRIRAWLGNDFLPSRQSAGYAISRRSDWEELQDLVCDASGFFLPSTPTAMLMRAFGLVRGEPLANISAPWADSERLAMALTIGDLVVELLDRPISRQLAARVMVMVGRMPTVRFVLSGRPDSPSIDDTLAARSPSRSAVAV